MSPSSSDPPDTAAVPVLGHRMLLHPAARDRFIAPSLARLGCFEPFQTEVVVNAVRPGDVAVDVGAHVGYYTLLLAALVGPAGRVLAFEPDPDNFALLQRNVALNGYANVELFHAAVSDRAGAARLYRCADNAGDHRLFPTAGEPRPAVDVRVVALDDVFRDRAYGVDVVKIDVQGSEGGVVDGMAGVLARSPRVTVLAEFWPAGLDRAGYGSARLLARLQDLGFRLYEVDEVARATVRIDPRALLARYAAADDEAFTNLLGVKAAIPAPPLRA